MPKIDFSTAVKLFILIGGGCLVFFRFSLALLLKIISDMKDDQQKTSNELLELRLLCAKKNSCDKNCKP